MSNTLTWTWEWTLLVLGDTQIDAALEEVSSCSSGSLKSCKSAGQNKTSCQIDQYLDAFKRERMGQKNLSMAKSSVLRLRRASARTLEDRPQGRCLTTLLAVASRKFDLDPGSTIPASTVTDSAVRTVMDFPSMVGSGACLLTLLMFTALCSPVVRRSCGRNVANCC